MKIVEKFKKEKDHQHELVEGIVADFGEETRFEENMKALHYLNGYLNALHAVEQITTDEYIAWSQEVTDEFI